VYRSGLSGIVTGIDHTPAVTCSTGGNSRARQARRWASPVTITDSPPGALPSGALRLPVMCRPSISVVRPAA
jgi:hypothetical protein